MSQEHVRPKRFHEVESENPNTPQASHLESLVRTSLTGFAQELAGATRSVGTNERIDRSDDMDAACRQAYAAYGLWLRSGIRYWTEVTMKQSRYCVDLAERLASDESTSSCRREVLSRLDSHLQELQQLSIREARKFQDEAMRAQLTARPKDQE